MQFQHTATLPAGKAAVWPLLMNVPEVSQCVPGVESVRPVEGNVYEGTMKLRVGPISLSFGGNLVLESQDESAGTAVLAVRGKDAKVAGAVAAKLEMQVEELSPSESKLTIVTNADIQGKLGEFGQPVIRKKTEQLMAEFAENLRKRVAAG